MNLKERIEQETYNIGRERLVAVINIAMLEDILDLHTAELIEKMEEMKHKECLRMKSSCLVNDTISDCQQLLMEGKNVL